MIDMSLRDVVIVGFPGVQPIDVVGPHEVFAGANSVLEDLGRAACYRVTVVSSEGQVQSASGLRVLTDSLPGSSTAIDTLVIPGGDGVFHALHDRHLVDWVRRTAPRCRRVACVCTGSFLAAEAGLLDGRSVTTHWARAEQLARLFPEVRVDAEPLYRRDGNVWTSAGVTAGIDLSLALVSDDVGTVVAQTVSRWLVMFLHRPGGQSQYAAPVWTRHADRDGIRVVQQMVEADPGGDHSVTAMARRAAMSPRHFSRVFAAEVGASPARFVESVRVQRARDLLESTADTLDTIAAHCGFGTAETLRRAVHRHLGVAPDTYRRRFRLAG
jgi:transcriptional regulator GlxA family with amidase domain